MRSLKLSKSPSPLAAAMRFLEKCRPLCYNAAILDSNYFIEIQANIQKISEILKILSSLATQSQEILEFMHHCRAIFHVFWFEHRMESVI